MSSLDYVFQETREQPFDSLLSAYPNTDEAKKIAIYLNELDDSRARTLGRLIGQHPLSHVYIYAKQCTHSDALTLLEQIKRGSDISDHMHIDLEHAISFTLRGKQALHESGRFLGLDPHIATLQSLIEMNTVDVPPAVAPPAVQMDDSSGLPSYAAATTDETPGAPLGPGFSLSCRNDPQQGGPNLEAGLLTLKSQKGIKKLAFDIDTLAKPNHLALIQAIQELELKELDITVQTGENEALVELLDALLKIPGLKLKACLNKFECDFENTSDVISSNVIQTLASTIDLDTDALAATLQRLTVSDEVPITQIFADMAKDLRDFGDAAQDFVGEIGQTVGGYFPSISALSFEQVACMAPTPADDDNEWEQNPQHRAKHK